MHACSTAATAAASGRTAKSGTGIITCEWTCGMPHYNEDDAYRLLRDVPVMNLLRPSAGLYLLRRHVQNLEAWRDFVPLYGSVRCAPLDFLYTYLQCVAALDDL